MLLGPYVCLCARITKKTIDPIHSCFLYKGEYTRGSVLLGDAGITHLLKDSSPLRDRTKCMNVRHDIKSVSRLVHCKPAGDTLRFGDLPQIDYLQQRTCVLACFSVVIMKS